MHCMQLLTPTILSLFVPIDPTKKRILSLSRKSLVGIFRHHNLQSNQSESRYLAPYHGELWHSEGGGTLVLLAIQHVLVQKHSTGKNATHDHHWRCRFDCNIARAGSTRGSTGSLRVRGRALADSGGSGGTGSLSHSRSRSCSCSSSRRSGCTGRSRTGRGQGNRVDCEGI